MGYGSKTVAECVDRVRTGETIASVARDTGVSESAIGTWCRNTGIAPKRHRREWTSGEMRALAEMWADGRSYDDIAATLGRTSSSVKACVSRNPDTCPPRDKGPRAMHLRVQELENEVLRLRSIIRGLGLEP